MQDAKEEVRARLNIEDVVGEYVQLKRAGRNFKGLSPFSGEKTPSFIVSPDKHIWHDFSSNKGGDIFSFVMEVEGMDFRQALEHLARKAGVDLTPYESKGSQDLARRKKRLLEANNLAADYYQHSMLQNNHALEYIFKKRGLSKQIVENFRIGYAPTAGDALIKFLTKKGFSGKELSDSGLTNRFGGDMFRGRMMVPLMDSSGQVIGFTARIIDEDPQAPKYLNTPQTLLYDKGRHVFGLSQAKEAIRTNDYAVIVEGNLDVVSSHQAGITQVVASAGTAMTEFHLQALKRLSGNIRLAFDGDKAGLAATERAIPIASQVGVELTIISLPGDAKDPDELIQQDVTLWQQAIDSAKPAVDWVLEQYAKREDITTASGVGSFTTQALAIVQQLSDAVVREHYENKIAQMVGTSLEALRAKLEASAETVQSAQLRPIVSHGTAASRAYDHTDTLLGLALTNVSIRDLFADVDPAIFLDARQALTVSFLKNSQTQVSNDIPTELRDIDEYINVVLVRAEKRYGSWDEKDQYFEAAKLLREYKTEHEKQRLEDAIKQAEASNDSEEVDRLRGLHYILIKEMKRSQR